MRRDKWIVVLVIFLTVFVTHSAGPTIAAIDSKWYLPTAMSIIRQGDADLDEYADMMAISTAAIDERHGHRYNSYPLAVSVLASPLVWGIDAVDSYLLSADLDQYIRRPDARRLETYIASFFVAWAAVFVHLIARRFLGLRALWITFILAFCTSAWSTASRALWQHGPAMLMLSIALWLLVSARDRPGLVPLAGIPLALAYMIRPTNSISVVLLTLFVCVRYRRYLPGYLLGLGAVATPFVLFNLSTYGSVLAPYFAPQKLLTNARFFEALAGNLVSPARGLFVFTPVLLLSGVGVVCKIRNRQFGLLDGCLAAVIVLHWIAISSFGHWWGGHSYGPRFFADLLPYLVYFLIPVVARLHTPAPGRRVLAAAFYCLVALSFSIHFRGANRVATAEWNSKPVDVDFHPERLWDWSDAQFLRGLDVPAPELRVAPLPAWYPTFLPHNAAHRFSGLLALEGYRLSADPLGREACVILYWQASQPPGRDWVVSVCLKDEMERTVARSDHAPGTGAGYRPAAWRARDWVADKHTLPIPAHLGAWRVEVRVCDPETGESMPVAPASDAAGECVVLDQALARDEAGVRPLVRDLWRDVVVQPVPGDSGSAITIDDGARLDFPAGAFVAPVTLTCRRLWSAAPTTALVDVGLAFELEAADAPSGRPAQLEPQQTYTLTLHYADADLGPAIEGTLALYHWEGARWTRDPSSVLDAARNTLTATPARLSRFAVLGETRRTFFPRVRRTLW